MAERHYRVAPAAERIAAPIESLVALYHRASGQTHLLAQPLPEVIAALDGGDCTVDTLLARLDVRPDAASRAGMIGHLAQLEAIGLVAHG